ncbi:MAG TPA: hypothetical protein VJJ76_02520 [archaeon]|nr:hypothetical protein [archaeon]
MIFMDKNYFRASLVFTAVSIVSIFAGIFYGFSTDLFSFIKPITVLQYAAFLAFAFFLNANRERIERSNNKQFWILLGFFIAMVSFYEVLFNFFYWFSLYNFYGLGADIDTLRNILQMNRFSIFNATGELNATEAELLNKIGLYPISLNLASKLTVLLFFCSVYWIYFVNNLNYNSSRRKHQAQ